MKILSLLIIIVLLLIQKNKINAQLVNYISLNKVTNKSINNVYSITTNDNKFIYTATQDGVYRFDGINVKKIQVCNSINNKIKTSFIKKLLYDEKHKIVVALSTNEGIAIISDKRKDICLQFIDLKEIIEKKEIIDFRIIDNSYFIFTDSSIFIYDFKFNESANTFLAIFKNKIENVFPLLTCKIDSQSIGILDKFFTVKKLDFHKNNAKFTELTTRFSLPKNITQFFTFVYHNNNFYLGTEMGMYSTGNSNLQSTLFLKKQSIYSMLSFAEKLFISGSEGLYVLSKKEEIVQLQLNSTKSNFLKNVFSLFGSGKTIWLGTQNELAFFEDYETPFFKIQLENSDNAMHAYHLGFSKLNDLLISSTNGFYLNSSGNNLFKLADSSSFFLNFVDPKGNQFVSGINKTYILKNKVFIPIGRIYSEFRDHENLIFNDYEYLDDGNVLLSTENNQGIYIWNFKSKMLNKINETKYSPNTISQNNGLYKIGEKIFILTDKEIYKYRNNELKKINISGYKGTKPSIFFDMLFHQNNYYILCYGLGVIKTDTNFNITEYFDQETGLSNNNVYKILATNDSLLFISTNDGINIINTKTNHIKIFNLEDGLCDDVFEEFSAVNNKDKLYFGGKNGISVIDLKKIRFPIQANNLQFLDYKLIDNKNSATENNIINQDKLIVPNNIIQTTISFQNVIYPYNSKNKYYYKIKELHNKWIDLGQINFVTLMGLKPGNYTLQVKTRNKDGIESEPIELTIIFLPKWYQTWWFKTLIVLSIIGIAYLLYKMRIAQIIKEQKIKNALASDLHDELGSSLTGLKVYAYQAKKNPEYMESLEEGISQSIKSVREMIWQLNEEKLTVYDLINKLAIIYKPLLKINNIALNINVATEISSIELNQKEKSHLYLILKEIINNAMKYAQASELNIGVAKGKSRLRFSIADNGIGIQGDSKGYGLKNIEARAKEIKYAISRESDSNGTVYFIEK